MSQVIAATRRPSTPGPSARHQVTFSRIVLSELTKLRSLRSTLYSLLLAVVGILGLSVLVTLVTVSHWPPRDPGAIASFDPASRSLSGVFLAQLAVGVLGVMMITGEYSTGMIRATLAAVPARVPVLWAKALVFGAATLLVMVPAVLGGFLIGQSILAGKGISTTLGAPGVLRVIIGTALYLTLVGLFGLGLGGLLRNTAGAISALFGIMYVVPIVLRFLPSEWADPINKWLPRTAGETITRLHEDPTLFAPWTGLALFLGYVVLALVAASVLLRRRDA